MKLSNEHDFILFVQARRYVIYYVYFYTLVASYVMIHRYKSLACISYVHSFVAKLIPWIVF